MRVGSETKKKRIIGYICCDTTIVWILFDGNFKIPIKISVSLNPLIVLAKHADYREELHWESLSFVKQQLFIGDGDEFEYHEEQEQAYQKENSVKRKQ